MAAGMTKFLLCCLVVLSSWLMVKPITVHACSCAMLPSIKDDMERKAAIFAGKVISITPPDKKAMVSSADPVRIVFEVRTVWKGNLASETEISTAMSSASCGYEGFVADTEYLVFAYKDSISNKLETGVCERTKLLASADEELTALGKGYAPMIQPAKTNAKQPGSTHNEHITDQSQTSRFLLLGLSLAVIVLVSAARYIISRRRRP